MKIEREKTAFLLVDMQERLYPAMYEKEYLLSRLTILLEGMKNLGVPMLAARQYPKGLGDVLPEVKGYFSQFYDKQTFSCCHQQELLTALKETGCKYVVVAGVESHICVLQTLVDLKAQGFVPVVVVDAVGSRKPSDKEVALRRMEQEGILLTTVEAVLFELCGCSGTDTFKTISKLIL